MKKVLFFSILFIIPLLIAIILVPIDKRYKYQYLDNDCFNHAIWVHDRIFNNETPVDIAFLGSSHTVNGINDRKIDSLLSDTSSHVVNLGYCRLGNNLHYVLLKDLLKKKNPRIVIIEVRGDEDWFSHPVFPYLADERDVFLPKVLVNRNIFRDYYLAFTYKLQLMQDILFKKVSDVSVRTELFGYTTSSDTAQAENLMQAKMRRQHPSRKMSTFERNFQMKYPRSYTKKIADLCNRYDIDLYFLYLPHYAAYYKMPLEREYYQRYGTIVYPPDTIMTNPYNWYDDEHLNKAGADKLASWLANKLESR